MLRTMLWQSSYEKQTSEGCLKAMSINVIELPQDFSRIDYIHNTNTRFSDTLKL